MRKSQHELSQSQGREHDAQSSDDKVNTARQHQARKRQRLRAEMHAQVASAVKSMSDAARLFEMRVRADGEEATRKIKPGAAEKIKDKVLDKIFEGFRVALVQAADVGEHLAEHGAKAFSVIKGFIDERIKEKQAQTAADVADAIHAGLVEKSILLQESLDATIDKLPPAKLLAAGKIMDAAEAEGREAAKEDGGDGPGRGDLGEAMRQDAMVNLLGLPASGLLAAEDLAVAAYSAFKSEVAASMSAREAIDDVQHKLDNPDEAREKIQQVEEKRHGPKFHEKMDEEKTLKGRVAQVRS